MATDPKDKQPYKPVDQDKFDEMRIAIEQAVRSEHRFLIARSYHGVDGYDPKDLLAAVRLAGSPPADAPEFAPRLVEYLGPKWIKAHKAAAEAHAKREAAASSAKREPVEPKPLWPGHVMPGPKPVRNRRARPKDARPMPAVASEAMAPRKP